MAQAVDILRTGTWLTRERVRLVVFGLLAASLIAVVYIVGTSDGLNDRFGRPLGTDFSNVYAAGTYVLDGNAAAPFDPRMQYAREQAIFGADTQFYGWHYPPYFLGLAALFAAMPYALALALSQGITFALYLGVTRAILSTGRGRALADPLWLPIVIGFPAVFVNLGHGHNGFLTAALFGAALLQLERKPVLAGVLFGCIAYKPQFGLLIPVVLAASGRWRAFAAAAATVAVLTIAVTITFGVDIWNAFLASTRFTRTVVLEQGDTGWHKIQSVFSVVRMWGGGIALAYAIQVLVTLAVAGGLAWLWRSRAAFPIKAAALAIGTILATPYSLDYDLMLLAPAIAFLAADGMQRGFRPWQKSLLAALWLVPILTRPVAHATLIPLAVPVMLVAFAWLLRRVMTQMGTTTLWRFATRPLK
jgi:hypothetical protein